jgi:hypothetical protein
VEHVLHSEQIGPALGLRLRLCLQSLARRARGSIELGKDSPEAKHSNPIGGRDRDIGAGQRTRVPGLPP